MKRILTYAFASLLSISGWAQTEVEPFVPGSTLEGVNYFLPKTALRVIVEVEKTEVKPGELHKYAFHYLRLNDVPKAASTTYRLKSIKLDTYGMPDSRKAYNIKVKSKTVAPLVGLSDNGILLSINKEADPVPQLSAVPNDIPAAAPIDARRYYTQEMLIAGSMAKLAELCSQEIYDIREARNELVRGEADNTPKDGAQLQLMLDQLDLQANALESLFKGTTTTSTEYTVLYITPEETGEKIAFRFSQKLGVVDSDNLAGSPIYINIAAANNLPESKPLPEVTKKKEKMEKGVYYNVPAKSTISMYDNQHNTLLQMDCMLAQFGTTEILSDMLFNKNSTIRVSFVPETGGIEKIEQ